MRPKLALFAAVVALVVGVSSTPAGAAAARRPVITSISSHNGTILGGGVVTVHGRNINSHLTVSFFGRPIGYRRVSDGVVTVRLPAHPSPGAGWLRVRTTRGGMSGRSSASRYIYHWPRPQLTSATTTIDPHTGVIGVRLVGRYIHEVRAVNVAFAYAGHYSVDRSGLGLTVAPFTPAPGRSMVRIATISGTAQIVWNYYGPPTLDAVSADDGPVAGGQTVSLHGSRFVSPLTVHFGAAQAQVVRIVDPTTITVLTPPHPAGPVTVSVATRYGSTSTDYGIGYRFGPAVAHQWSAPQTVDPDRQLLRLSCPTVDFCAGLDSYDRYLIRDSSGWSTPSALPGPPPGSDYRRGLGLSCTSADFCMVGVGVHAWTWDGTAWSLIPTPPGAEAAYAGITRVSCTSSTFCVALTARTLEIWDGASWSAAVNPFADAGGELFDVSCWADSHCVALDEDSDVSVLDGVTWTAAGYLPYYETTPVQCAGASSCAFGADGGVSIGSDLVRQVLPTPVTRLECASAQSCVAAGAGPATGEATFATWDGTQWSTSSAAPDVISAISCPAAGSCVVASDHDVRTLTW